MLFYWRAAVNFFLQLQGCYVGDKGLAAIGECCKQLDTLKLRFCEGLTDAGLVELALGVGKSLKSFSVAACAKITDRSLEAVGSSCESLETLSVDSEFIHDKGLLAVVNGCKCLRVLKLQYLKITDEALKAVGNFCLSLEQLALTNIQDLTDLSVNDSLNFHASAVFVPVLLIGKRAINFLHAFVAGLSDCAMWMKPPSTDIC